MTTSTNAAPLTVAAAQPRTSLVMKMANRFNVEAGKLMGTLKATAFKTQGGVTDEQMMALLIVADQYGLNPFTKEIFAFPDKGGIVPVVGVDGWARIINEAPSFDGVSFSYSTDEGDLSCTCTMHRKDRTHPIAVTEYLSECKRGTGPWASHPRRMLRHKALIQAARLAFGFAGIYDEDEAHRIREMGDAEVVPRPGSSIAAVRQQLQGGDVVDLSTGEVQTAETIDVPPAPPAEPKQPPAPRGRAPKQSAPSQPGRIDAPLDKTLAQLLQELERAPDSDMASLVLDTARHLPETEYNQLIAAYRERFGEG